MIVVDTNVIAYLYLTTPQTALSEGLLAAEPSWCAPRLWRSELRNVLRFSMRRGAITLETALRIMREAEALMHLREYEVASSTVLSLANESGCTAYDCEFVAVARYLGVPLVTADKALRKRFPGVALPLDGAVEGLS